MSFETPSPRTTRGRSSRTAARSAGPTLADRLLAALLAPPTFNLFLWIVMAMWSRRGVRWHLLDLPVMNAWTLGWVFVVLPALAGFVAGTDGLVSMAGHAFLTHAEHEQRWWATLLIWAVIAGSAYLVAHR